MRIQRGGEKGQGEKGIRSGNSGKEGVGGVNALKYPLQKVKGAKEFVALLLPSSSTLGIAVVDFMVRATLEPH